MYVRHLEDVRNTHVKVCFQNVNWMYMRHSEDVCNTHVKVCFQNEHEMYVRHSEDVCNTHSKVCFQKLKASWIVSLRWVQNVSCTFNLRSVSRKTFGSASKSVVFVKRAILKIQKTSQRLFTVAELNGEFSKVFPLLFFRYS